MSKFQVTVWTSSFAKAAQSFLSSANSERKEVAKNFFDLSKPRNIYFFGCDMPTFILALVST